MRKILLIILPFFVISCNGEKQKKEKYEADTIDSLEIELVKLKNQAFCECYYRALHEVNGEITPSDGSTYLQISVIVQKYWNDENLKRLVLKWNMKKYSSYSDSNKLYLMRCLDFYNSKDLKLYIDSVRRVELKENPKWDK